ncbi:Serine--tRNA ligase [Devosia sp. LC5]|uniref:serine--tRNA ligase n=1 Tax=Devosia sp. LC5 TaxID=1502724 RepID=UPI0004E405BB|nr:serine--tRNA ligase [Devosia sp. LC5]KFC69991.1 Serine--tRNA ligase [Devosia sp. LC5]
MFDIKWIRANAEAFDAAISRRKGVSVRSSDLLAIDDRRREIIASLNEAQEKRNALSKQIGQAKAQKDEAKAAELMAGVAALKEAIPQGEADERAVELELRNALSVLPNLAFEDVPDGVDEADNVEYFGPNGSPATAAKARAPKPSFSFAPKEHYEVGVAANGDMDFELAAKLSGSRFVVLKGQVARLERALGQFMLDLHTTEHGYTEVQPPLLVKDDALFGTNQLPKFEEDLFATSRDNASTNAVMQLTQREYGLQLVEQQIAKLADHSGRNAIAIARLNRQAANERMAIAILKTEIDSHQIFEGFQSSKLYLIPTAEVPLTNLVRESIVSEEALPMRLTALTPCFRSEAGSAGRDTRGMLRQHQFNKVEMVSITTPETSVDEHERMLTCAEAVLQKLGLHYRVMTLCTGDLGFGAKKTYDLEVWLPGQDTYREISSVSVCGDFQARRMDARYRPAGEKQAPRFVHTLNGSGTAVGRCLIAVLENYQQEDGSVLVPEVLRPYMGGLTSIGGR